MKHKDGVIYSVWKIIRLILISSIIIVALNMIPFMIYGKLLASFTNYSIALGVVCGTLICVRIIEKKKLIDIGLAFRIRDIYYFVIGIFATIVLINIIIVIASVQQKVNLYPQLFTQLLQSKRSVLAFMVIPLIEEVIHRGYILNNTFAKLKIMHRSILSALLFSITHWSNIDNVSLVIFIFAFVFSTFMFGLLFNYLACITQSIWCGFGFHWCYNFLVATLFMNTSNYNLAVISTTAFLIIGMFVFRRTRYN